MALIKPKYVFKNVKSANQVASKLSKLDISNIILILDVNIQNEMIHKIVKSLDEKFNIVYMYEYEGGEPQTTHLDLFLQDIYCFSIDAIIAIGGGSTLDFAKATSVLCKNKLYIKSSDYQGINFQVDKKVMCVCIPTTAGSGAEATKSAVMFNPNTNVKRGINNLKVLPEVVFLVPSLTKNLPEKVFYPSLLDGVTHAFESLIGKSSTRQTIKLAKKSLKLYRKQLNSRHPYNNYHKKILQASFFAGQAICNSETGPVHALSYPVSEFLKVSHGQAISLILPRIILFYNEWSRDLTDPLILNLGFKNIRELIEKIDEMNKNFVLPYINIGKTIDFEVFAQRSMELQGAINNSPIVWNKGYSIKIYEEIFR